MRSKYKPQSNTGTVKAVLTGVITATLVMLLCIGIAAMLIEKESVPEESTAAVVFCIQLIAAFCGSFLAGKRAGDKKVLAGAVAAAAYCFLLIALAVTCFDGMFQNVWSGFIAVAIGLSAALLLNIRKKSKVVGGRSKRYSR